MVGECMRRDGAACDPGSRQLPGVGRELTSWLYFSIGVEGCERVGDRVWVLLHAGCEVLLDQLGPDGLFAREYSGHGV